MPAAEHFAPWAWCARCALAQAGVALALCAGLIPPQAHAAEPQPAAVEANAGLDLGLEDLLRQGLKAVPQAVQVSTASRFAQSTEQAPAQTYVLTDAEIRAYGLRSMADILNCLPGLFTTSNGNFVYVAARGLGRPGDFNARLLLMIDGVRVNENIFDAALIGPEFYVDVDLIDRVEFTPGPGSALYGNNAFFGVIQVQTKRADKLAGLRARLALDSQRGGSWQASAGQRLDSGAEGWISISGFQQDRIPLNSPAPADKVDRLRDHNWDHGTRLLARASMAGWSFRAGHSERVRGNASPLDPTRPGSGIGQGRSIYFNQFAALGYEGALGANWDLTVEASSKVLQSRRRDPLEQPGRPPLELETLSEGQWDEFALRLGSSAWRGHYVLGGLEWQRDRLQRIALGARGLPPDLDFTSASERLGVFVQDEWQLHAQHRLVLGLRWDHDRRADGSRLNPRLAWVWQLSPEANLKLMQGSAYRAPNFYEFRSNQAPGLPVLEAERTRSLELALEHRLTPQLQYRASLYRARMSGLISQVLKPDTGLSFVNSDVVRSRGLELGLEKRWDGGARLQLGLSLQRSRELGSGAELDNSPRRLFKLAYSQPLWRDDLQLGWQTQAMSRRQVPAGSLPGQALHHLHLLWRQSADSEWSLGLRNLTGVSYADQPDVGLPPLRQGGRVLRLQFKHRVGS